MAYDCTTPHVVTDPVVGPNSPAPTEKRATVKMRFNASTGRLELPITRGIMSALLTVKLFLSALMSTRRDARQGALRDEVERLLPLLSTVESAWRAVVSPGKKGYTVNRAVCALRLYNDGQVCLPIDRSILVDPNDGYLYTIVPFLREGGYTEARDSLVHLRDMLICAADAETGEYPTMVEGESTTDSADESATG